MNTRELLRKQLDARLKDVIRMPPPKGGWIRTIRRALGMSMAQLGRQLGISQPSVAALELRDSRGTISVAKLQDVAEALGCDLVITFAPRIPLDEMVRRQATAKAHEEHARLTHTMRLEAQDDGIDKDVDIDRAIARWATKRTARLWD